MPQFDMVWINAVLLLVLLAVLYFFFLRPDKKSKQEKEQAQTNLKIGDRVYTRAGIHGTVTAIDGDLILIETGKACTELEILRSAILGLDDTSNQQKHTRTISINHGE